MNDRELDLLIQHVFGDAEGGEAAEAATVAARSPKEAALWAELKSDLRSLNEVPECQMSVERLQHAILNKTQKEAAKGWSLAKLYRNLAAGAAGVFALVVAFNMMPKATPEAIVATTGGGETVAMNDKPVESGAKIQPDLGGTTAAKPAPPVANEDPVEKPRQVISLPRNNNRSAPSAGDSDDGINKSEPDGRTRVADLGGPGEAAPASARNPEAGVFKTPDFESLKASDPTANPEESVVIVASSTNRDGTREAREVSRDEDVIFGG